MVFQVVSLRLGNPETSEQPGSRADRTDKATALADVEEGKAVAGSLNSNCVSTSGVLAVLPKSTGSVGCYQAFM